MTAEIVPGGPTREEAGELNQPKLKSKSRVGQGLPNVAVVGTGPVLPAYRMSRLI